MPVDFDSLGSYLRQERERQQVSLQEIAAATKIQCKFLEALEHDAYAQLPATPFVVGFLRAYAQYVALDPETVLTAYRSLHRAPEPPEVAPRPVPTPTPSPQRGQLIRLGVFLAVFGVFTGLVLHELRRGQPTRSPVASFPAGLLEQPRWFCRPPRLLPHGESKTQASQRRMPLKLPHSPHHAKKGEGLRAQARWCYRRQPWQIPGYGSKLMGTSAIPCSWPLARVCNGKQVNVFGSPWATSAASGWP